MRDGNRKTKLQNAQLESEGAETRELIGRVRREISALKKFHIDVVGLERKTETAADMLAGGDVENADMLAGQALAKARALKEIASISEGVVRKTIEDNPLASGGIDLSDVTRSVSELLLNSSDLDRKIAAIVSKTAPAQERRKDHDALLKAVVAEVIKGEGLHKPVAKIMSELMPETSRTQNHAETMRFMMYQVLESKEFTERLDAIIQKEIPDTSAFKNFVQEYTARALGKFLFQGEFEARVKELAPRLEPVAFARAEITRLTDEAMGNAFASMLDSEELNGMVVRIATTVSNEHHDRLSKSVVGELLANIERTVREHVRAYFDDNDPIGAVVREELDGHIQEKVVGGLVSFFQSGKVDAILDERMTGMKEEIELDLMTKLAAEIEGKSASDLREAVRSASLEDVREFTESTEIEVEESPLEDEEIIKEKEATES